MIQEIAMVLHTTPKNARHRIINMRLGVTCSRCGGSGNYSFNMMHGSMCYGCHGHGTVMPDTEEQWSATQDRAKRAAADGSLDHYILTLEARKRCKNGLDRAFAAWHEMDALNGYGKGWNNLNAMPNRDQVVARNKVGFDLVTALQKLDNGKNTDWIEYDRVLSGGLAELTKIIAELKNR